MANDGITNGEWVANGGHSVIRRSSFVIRCFLLWAVLALLLSSAGLVVADEAGDQRAVAAGHYSAGRWGLAAEEFARLLRDFPDRGHRAQVTYYLGEALVQLGRFDEARARYDEALALEPEGEFSRRALFRRGECAYLAGDPDAARADLQKFREAWPDDPLGEYALPYLGELALEAGEPARAEELLVQALQKYPDGALRRACRFHLARAHALRGQAERAEPLLQELADEPNGPLADRARYQLGLLLYGQGRFDDARKRLEGLVEHPKLGLDARYWLGMALRGAQKWQAAADAHLAAIESRESRVESREPSRAGASLARRPALNSRLSTLDFSDDRIAALRFYAGDSLLRAGKPGAAVEQFDAVLKAAPDGPWADDCLRGEAWTYLGQKQYAEAERAADELLARFGDGPLAGDARLLRGAARAALDKPKSAVEDLTQFLKANGDAPRAADALAELTLCYVKLGQLEDARAAYERLEKGREPRVESREPSRAGASRRNHSTLDSRLSTLDSLTQRLAEAAYAAGDHAWAAELFNRMTAEGNPPEIVAQGLSGLAWSKLKSNDPDGSAALFARLLKEYPDSALAPEAALARGRIFEDRAQADAALAMYQVVLDKYPDSREMPDALLRAGRLYDRLEQNEKADALYARLIDEHKDFARLDAALYGRAWTQTELGKPEEAAKLFSRLIADFPQSDYWPDAAYRLAKRATRRGDDARAEKLLAALVEAGGTGGLPTRVSDGLLASALYLQGRLAARREDWKAVEAPLARLLKETPQSELRLPAEYLLAEAAYRRDELELAAGRFEKLSRATDGRDDQWLAMVPLRRAAILARQDRWREALALAETIRQHYPDFARLYEADYLIGRCHAALGEFDQAREAYRAVTRSTQGGKTETAAMAQWMIGETYFHQKNFEEARREYLRTEILYAYPEWQAAALLQAGKCQESLAHWQDAVETYLELLKKYPDTNYSDDAERRLGVARQRKIGN